MPMSREELLRHLGEIRTVLYDGQRSLTRRIAAARKDVDRERAELVRRGLVPEHDDSYCIGKFNLEDDERRLRSLELLVKELGKP